MTTVVNCLAHLSLSQVHLALYLALIRPISDGLVAQANLIGAVIGQNLCAGVRLARALLTCTTGLSICTGTGQGVMDVCVGRGGGGEGGEGLTRKRNENSKRTANVENVQINIYICLLRLLVLSILLQNKYLLGF